MACRTQNTAPAFAPRLRRRMRGTLPPSDPRQTRETPTGALRPRGRGPGAAPRQGSPTLAKPLRNDYGLTMTTLVRYAEPGSHLRDRMRPSIHGDADAPNLRPWATCGWSWNHPRDLQGSTDT
jgi:hypothetical protein